MNLDKRYKAYLILAILLCTIGTFINFSSGNHTGLGALIIVAGGISLVLGITIKRKLQAIKSSVNQEEPIQEK